MGGNVSLADRLCNLVRSACAVACGKASVNARFHIFVHNNTAVLHLEFVQQNIRRNSLFDEKYAVNIKICAVCKLNARYLAVTDNRSNS